MSENEQNPQDLAVTLTNLTGELFGSFFGSTESEPVEEVGGAFISDKVVGPINDLSFPVVPFSDIEFIVSYYDILVTCRECLATRVRSAFIQYAEMMGARFEVIHETNFKGRVKVGTLIITEKVHGVNPTDFANRFKDLNPNLNVHVR